MRKAKAGMALGLVIVFIAIVTILGASMLLVASMNIRQTAGAVQFARHYYAAESLVQVAALMIENSFHGIGHNVPQDSFAVVWDTSDINTIPPVNRPAVNLTASHNHIARRDALMSIRTEAITQLMFTTLPRFTETVSFGGESATTTLTADMALSVRSQFAANREITHENINGTEYRSVRLSSDNVIITLRGFGYNVYTHITDTYGNVTIHTQAHATTWIEDIEFRAVATSAGRVVHAYVAMGIGAGGGGLLADGWPVLVSPGTPGTPAVPGAGGGGFTAGGSNLINGGASWNIWETFASNNGVYLSTGAGTYTFFPDGSSIPGTNFLEIMGRPEVGGQISVDSMTSTIRTNARNSLPTINSSTHPSGVGTNNLQVSGNRRIYASDYPNLQVIHGSGNITLVGDFPNLQHIALTGDNTGITLQGNFSNLSTIQSRHTVRLEGQFNNLAAVYTEQAVHFGSDAANGRGFSSNNTGSDTVYIFAGLPSYVNVHNGFVLTNAIFGGPNVLRFEGDAGNNLVRTDAQFYSSNVIYMGRSSTLVVDNWDSTYVPTFIGANDIVANVSAAGGFSGIFNATNRNGHFNLDTPSHNGAFLVHDGFNNMRLNNTHTSDPMRLYVDVRDASNMNDSIINYFRYSGAMIHDGTDTGIGEGTPAVPPTMPEFETGTATTQPAFIIREVTGR
jgi:Tfp pilus assembly protein PilX